MEEILLENQSKCVSKVYKILLTWFTEEEVVKHSMIKWAKNCGRTLDMSSWEFLWKSTQKMVIAAKIKENILKMQFRWYMTPKKLSYMNKNMSSKCWKCETEEGTFYHIWWTCSKARIFWEQINTELKKLIVYSFEKLPEIYLVSLKLEKFPKDDRILICYAIAAARMTYAQKWRLIEIPSVEDWLLKLHNFIDLDVLTRTLMNQNQKRYKVFRQKFKNYLKDTKTLSGLVL